MKYSLAGRTLAGLTFSLMAAQGTAVAAEDAIVVTATRQAQRANELLADVTVIQRDTIESSAQDSLGALLAAQAGVELVTSGSAGSATSLFIRGTNGEHALVLIDGLRAGSATLGTTDLARIPLAQIERIEILRGPASALYGADALGGVVQIFTRQGNGPASVNAEVAFGTYGTRKTSAGFAGATGGLRYSVQASYDETSGFSNIRNAANAAYNADRDGFRDVAVTGAFAYRIDADHEIGANVFASDGVNHYDGGYQASAVSDYRTNGKVERYDVFTRNRFAPAWQSTLRVGRGIDDAAYYQDRTQTSRVRTVQDQVTWQNDLTLPLGKALISAEWLHQGIETSQDYVADSRTIASLLAGWNANLGAHRWQINLRRDDISGAAAKTTGLLSYGYQFSPAWRASAALGTAYKVPSLNDLYFPYTAYVGQGNPDLKPESARNRELALHYETAEQTASLTYFDNRIADLIQWQETPVGSWFYVPQNVDSAHIIGWSLAYRREFGAWSVHASADWQNPRDASSGSLLTRRAKRHAVVGVDYVAGAWTVAGDVTATGARYSDTGNRNRMGGYALTNVSATYRIDRNVALFASIKNLFDRRYEEINDYAVAGRTALFGIRYQPH